MDLRTAVVSLAAAGALICGCSSTEDIRGRDSGARSTAFRALIDLSRGGRPPGVEAGERRPHSFGLEIDLVRSRGDDEQTIAMFEVIELDDTDFVGPRTLDLDFELETLSLAARWDLFKDGGEFAGLAGVEIVQREIEVSSGAVTERDRDTGAGPFVGVEIGGRPSDWMRIYGRLTTNLVFNGELANLLTGEVMLQVSPTPGLGFHAGWRFRDYSEERPGSDIDLTLSGPTVGVAIGF